MENHFYHIKGPPLNVTISITHVRNCMMGATQLDGNPEEKGMNVATLPVFFLSEVIYTPQNN